MSAQKKLLEKKKQINAKRLTGNVLKKLSRKGIAKLTNLINVSFRLKRLPSVGKIAEVIMILKVSKLPSKPISYMRGIVSKCRMSIYVIL